MVAGDIGNRNASNTLKELEKFLCPVLYIYGNWDNELPYNRVISENSEHIHLNPVRIENFLFAGFSGCDIGWGQNPIALKLKYELTERHIIILAQRKDSLAEYNKIRDLNGISHALSKQALRKYDALTKSAKFKKFLVDQTITRKNILNENVLALTKSIDAIRNRNDNIVIVTHERIYRIQEKTPKIFMHMFGHRHGFKVTDVNGIKFINVSMLDWPRIVRTDPYPMNGDKSLANYVVIEINNSGEININPIFLR